eukprot:474773_1
MSYHTNNTRRNCIIQQTAMNVKSQRQQRITETKQRQEIEENNKDIQMIFLAFDRIRERGITNTKQLTWEIMYKENKIDKHEQKKNQNEKIKNNTQISQLIDETHDEMCKFGHGELYGGKKYIKNSACIVCKSMNERKYCHDCFNYDFDR